MTTTLTREQVEGLANEFPSDILNRSKNALLDHDAALRAQVEGLKADKESLYAANIQLVKAYDDIAGTPCEQIRHAQEVEALTAQIEATENTWGEERVKLNEALLQLAAVTQEREALKAVVAGKGWQATLAFYDLKLAKAQARIKELEAQ